MDGSTPVYSDVSVPGGRLRVARFGTGSRVTLGLHGITGSSVQLAPVARRLSPNLAMVSPDLRGRGGSNTLPGPYGMEAHARDCAEVISQVSDRPVVVLGESMGAYVAVVLAARFPDLVERLVLADGGIPLSVPDGLDPDAVLEAVLGPALARLNMVFETREAYFDFWRAHPAFSEAWGADVEEFLAYDLEPTERGFRSRARPEPVRVDGRQHIVSRRLVEDALDVVTCPVHLVRATRNLVDEEPPLLSEEAVAPWRSRIASFGDEVVEDTNHYTLFLCERGAQRLADLVAEPQPGGGGGAESAGGVA